MSPQLPSLPRRNSTAAVICVLAAVLGLGEIRAHNLDQRNTSIAFDPPTIGVMATRSAASQPLIKGDDVLGVICKSTPGPGTRTGAGGYLTFFIPPGTQVQRVEYVIPDGAGGYQSVPLKPPAPLPLGAGPIAPATTTALKGLILGPNVTGQSAATVNGSGVHTGTIAGLYGDTGIFYSTDPATGWQTFTSAGGYDGNVATVDNILTNNDGERLVPLTKWDADQLIAFGVSRIAVPVIDPNGRGSTPWGMGSPVAGPQSGYAWGFNRTYWLANPGDPSRMKNSIAVGPWKRIRYTGSTVAKDVPGTMGGVDGGAYESASTLGTVVSPATPLPPTISLTDSTSPKAIRIAYGELALGRSEFMRVELKVLASAGQPGSPFDQDGAINLRSDAFGGDAGGTSNGRDHVWRYVDANPLEIKTNGHFQKTFERTPVLKTETSYFDLTVINTASTPMTNVVVKDAMPVGLSYVSASLAPSSTSPLTWVLGTVPAQGYLTIRVNYTATKTGTIFNTATLSSDQITRDATDSVDVISLTPDDPEPSVLKVGNLVFRDANLNGQADAGEGVNGVTVQLFDGEADVSADTPLASTVTAGGGFYQFAGLPPGEYLIHIPPSMFTAGGPLAGLTSLAGMAAGDDDFGEDTRDAPEPWITGLTTHEFELRTALCPVNATSETGLGKTSDDTDDANGDMTIDIGVVQGVAIGNLVFIDANSNGHADPGEGYDGVTVQLYSSSQVPGVDVPLDVTVTSAGGRYLFSGLAPGSYRVHIPSFMFSVDTPMQAMISVPEGLSGDDDVGEDGINVGDLSVSGISSGVVTLSLGTAPTDLNGETGVDSTIDDSFDAAVDLTVDFGFQLPLSVGNLVFVDANGNGHYDNGEGVSGVTLELYPAGHQPGAGAPMFTTITDAAGKYRFSYLPSGNFIIHIPASNFVAGGPLAGKVSLNGAPDTGDDDVSEDGLDDAAPHLNGITSRPFHIQMNGLPDDASGETGAYHADDNLDDANGDLTIDFGFAIPNPNAVGIGNTVFLDADGDAAFTPGEGVPAVKMELFAAAADPLTTAPLAVTFTDVDGTYYFGNLAGGSYFVRVAPSNFQAGGALDGLISLPGAGSDDGTDDVLDENGIDSAAPAITGISSSMVVLQAGTEPTDNASEVGHAFFTDGLSDANSDLTIDFGFMQPVGVGDLVFVDANGNGHADPGEGVSGVTVEIFELGKDPMFDPPAASTMTDAQGRYLFGNMLPGLYFIYIPGSEFAFGRPLYSAVSLPGVSSGDDDTGEDGFDEALPQIFGIGTNFIVLQPGMMPAGAAESGLFGSSDDALDGMIDTTVDLGFTRPALRAIKGQVRNDGDQDGSLLDVDPPLPGVTLSLYEDDNANGIIDASDALLTSVISGADGRYSFNNLPTGGSFIVVETDPLGATSTADAQGSNDNKIAVTIGASDSLGNDFLDSVLPSGYIYDPADGSLVTGGTVTVSGPGNVWMLLDGTTGAYAWITDGTPGLYSISYLPATGRLLDATRPPQVVAFDPTGKSSPFAIGSGLNASARLTNFSSAANPWYAAFDLAPGDALTTRNNIPVTIVTPRTWAQWQYGNPLSGQNGPTHDPDGDGTTNLAEFVFGLAPDSGLVGVPPFELLVDPVAGVVDAWVRKLGVLDDVTVTLQGLSDLSLSPAGWSDITSITPEIGSTTNGVQTSAWRNVEQVALFSGGKGFLRLKLSLDADHNGTPEATATTEVWGFSRRIPGTQIVTCSNPFLKAPVFTGAVTSVGGASLDVAAAVGAGSLAAHMTGGVSYYIEVTSGDNEGHRFEVDEALSSAGTLVLETSSPLNTLASIPATLTGDRVALYSHWSMAEWLPPSKFRATNNSASADRVMLYGGTGFSNMWLYSNAGTPKWVNDATLVDRGTRIIDPAEAVMIQPRFTSAPNFVNLGVVRAHNFATPVKVGTWLVAGGYPMDQSATSRNILFANGFTGSNTASRADRIQIWVGDNTPGASTYDSYYLLKTSTLQQWVKTMDAGLTNQNNASLFKAMRGVFFNSVSGKPDYVMPRPWTP